LRLRFLGFARHFSALTSFGDYSSAITVTHFSRKNPRYSPRERGILGSFNASYSNPSMLMSGNK